MIKSEEVGVSNKYFISLPYVKKGTVIHGAFPAGGISGGGGIAALAETSDCPFLEKKNPLLLYNEEKNIFPFIYVLAKIGFRQ